MASQSDERFGGDRPRTANEKLLNYQLMHSHYLERFNASEVKRIDAFLRGDVLPDIYGKLIAKLERIRSRGYDSAVESTQRWQSLHESITAIIDAGVSDVRKSSVSEMKVLSKYEAGWQVKALERAVPAEIGLSFEMPSPEVLRELVSERPIAGKNVGEWWDDLTIDTTKRIEREVRVGLAEGQSVPDIAKRITGTAELKGTDGVFEVTNRHAKAIVRNSSIHVSNQARQEVYKANRDIVREEQWIATLDLRTCPTCGSRDGKRFKVGEGPMPPAHPPGPSGGACRCARTPVVKSLNEIFAAAGSKRRFKDFGPGTRASMNGQVAATTTYAEWLNELDADELSEALGASRAKLFTDGELSLDRMVDQSGRALTLEQIALREEK